MGNVLIIGKSSISQSEVDEIVKKIIKIFSDKKITHAVAHMILDEVEEELKNTIVRKIDWLILELH